MKQAGLLIVVLAGITAAGAASATEFSRLGGHAAVSLLGDIGQTQIGGGLQTELRFSPMWAAELAVSWFADEPDDAVVSVDQDLATVGLSALCRQDLVEDLSGYLLTGVNLNMPNVDVTDESVAVTQVDASEKIGFHLGAGVAWRVGENFEWLLEYRYTFLALDAEMTTTASGTTSSRQIVDDYDFGLLKLGFNFVF